MAQWSVAGDVDQREWRSGVWRAQQLGLKEWRAQQAIGAQSVAGSAIGLKVRDGHQGRGRVGERLMENRDAGNTFINLYK